MPDLENEPSTPKELANRIAAEMGAIPGVPMTAEQSGEFGRRFTEAMRDYPFKYRIRPESAPLGPGEVRQLLRECVTAVGPGESLVVRVPWNTEPLLIRELYQAVRSLDLPFETLIVPGDELAVAETPDAP